MSSSNNQISVSDIVNAKIVDLLLECCRKTVMECSYHYGFDCQEALGKMGLLTDYSALTNLTMSQVGVCVNSESGSVSDVSTDEVVKDDETVGTKVLVLPVEVSTKEGNKGKKEKVVKEKKEKVVKEKVVKEKKEKVVKEKNNESLETKVLVDVAVSVSPEEEGKKEKVVKEKVVKEKVVKEKVVKKKVVKEKPLKEVKEVVNDLVNEVVSVSSSLSEESGSNGSKKGRPKKEKEPKEKKEKGRPKKEKKETESTSAIDDLFANLVAKDVVKEEVKKVVNEVVVSVSSKVPDVVPKVDVVNKIEFQGTTYLKSKNTGIIYNMEQDVIGKWNENTSTIDFDEEEEEEYEDE